MKELKEWLQETVKNMSKETIKSIKGNHNYLETFMATFKI